MKLSTILFPLALVLGLASATGIEKDASLKTASLKTALRVRLEDATRSEQKEHSGWPTPSPGTAQREGAW